MISLTTKLQKLVVLAVVLVIIMSIAFTVTLVVTSKETSANAQSEDTIFPQKTVTIDKIKELKKTGPGKEIGENENKTIISSQHFLLPHLWNAILICLVFLACSVIALVWDAERQGKVDIFERSDQEQRETEDPEETGDTERNDNLKKGENEK